MASKKLVAVLFMCGLLGCQGDYRAAGGAAGGAGGDAVGASPAVGGESAAGGAPALGGNAPTGGAVEGGAGLGGGFAAGPCGDCLISSCGEAVEACSMDPNCAAVVDCTATSGCITAEVTQEQIADCVQACGDQLGLTNQEKVQVASQLADLAACAPDCAQDCQGTGRAP